MPCRRALVSRFRHPASICPHPHDLVLPVLKLFVVTLVCRPQSQRQSQTRCRFLLVPTHRTASSLPKRTPARSRVLGMTYRVTCPDLATRTRLLARRLSRRLTFKCRSQGTRRPSLLRR
jgi:hypothetical protein